MGQVRVLVKGLTTNCKRFVAGFGIIVISASIFAEYRPSYPQSEKNTTKPITLTTDKFTSPSVLKERDNEALLQSLIGDEKWKNPDWNNTEITGTVYDSQFNTTETFNILLKSYTPDKNDKDNKFFDKDKYYRIDIETSPTLLKTYGIYNGSGFKGLSIGKKSLRFEGNFIYQYQFSSVGIIRRDINNTRTPVQSLPVNILLDILPVTMLETYPPNRHITLGNDNSLVFHFTSKAGLRGPLGEDLDVNYDHTNVFDTHSNRFVSGSNTMAIRLNNIRKTVVLNYRFNEVKR